MKVWTWANNAQFGIVHVRRKRGRIEVLYISITFNVWHFVLFSLSGLRKRKSLGWALQGELRRSRWVIWGYTKLGKFKFGKTSVRIRGFVYFPLYSAVFCGMSSYVMISAFPFKFYFVFPSFLAYAWRFGEGENAILTRLPFWIRSVGNKSKPNPKEGDEKKRKKAKDKSKEIERVVPVEVLEEGPITMLTAKELAKIIQFFPHFQLFRCMRVSKIWNQAARSISLETFELKTFYGYFEDEHLAAIVAKHPNMHTISIRAAPRITEKSMKYLAKLPLTKLDLSNCRNLGDSSLIKIPQIVVQKLTSLTVAHCGFSERALKLGVLPALTHLDISNCDNISNRFALYMVQYTPVLESLNAANSPSFTNDFLANIPRIVSLTSLSVRNCPYIDHNGFRLFATAPNPTAPNPYTLPRLTTLDIASTLVNNAALLQICSSYRSLTDLSLALCHRIDDEGTGQLNLLTGLTSLNLSYTGIGIKTLERIKTVPLQILTVSGCRYLKEHIKSFIRNNPNIHIINRTTTLPNPDI